MIIIIAVSNHFHHYAHGASHHGRPAEWPKIDLIIIMESLRSISDKYIDKFQPAINILD